METQTRKHDVRANTHRRWRFLDILFQAPPWIAVSQSRALTAARPFWHYKTRHGRRHRHWHSHQRACIFLTKTYPQTHKTSPQTLSLSKWRNVVKMAPAVPGFVKCGDQGAVFTLWWVPNPTGLNVDVSSSTPRCKLEAKQNKRNPEPRGSAPRTVPPPKKDGRQVFKPWCKVDRTIVCTYTKKTMLYSESNKP